MSLFFTANDRGNKVVLVLVKIYLCYRKLTLAYFKPSHSERGSQIQNENICHCENLIIYDIFLRMYKDSEAGGCYLITLR